MIFKGFNVSICWSDPVTYQMLFSVSGVWVYVAQEQKQEVVFREKVFSIYIWKVFNYVFF